MVKVLSRVLTQTLFYSVFFGCLICVVAARSLNAQIFMLGAEVGLFVGLGFGVCSSLGMTLNLCKNGEQEPATADEKRILMALLLVVGLGAFGLGTNVEARYHMWLPVTAKVQKSYTVLPDNFVRMGSRYTRGRIEYYPKITYEYVVKGAKYTETIPLLECSANTERIAKKNVENYIAQTPAIEVFYNSSNPKESALTQHDVPLWFARLLEVFGSVTLLVALFVAVRIRKGQL